MTLAVACALPGRPVRVLPEVAGGFVGATLSADADLLLVVMQRESPSLHARQRVELTSEGRFRFEPIDLDVAGHEFSKRYRIYLHLRSAGSDRVIWRAELSRFETDAPIPLECDLARPAALGEACRVRDPLRQPWLLTAGKRSFERLCARCHGSDGQGAEFASSVNDSTGLPVPPPNLTQIAARQGGRFEHDRVAAWIEGRTPSPTHSRNGMPVWGERLSNEFERYAEGDELIGATLDPIIAYLESLQLESPQLESPQPPR